MSNSEINRELYDELHWLRNEVDDLEFKVEDLETKLEGVEDLVDNYKSFFNKISNEISSFIYEN